MSPQVNGAECSHHSECASDCCLMDLDRAGAFCAPRARMAMLCLFQVMLWAGAADSALRGGGGYKSPRGCPCFPTLCLECPHHFLLPASSYLSCRTTPVTSSGQPSLPGAHGRSKVSSSWEGMELTPSSWCGSSQFALFSLCLHHWREPFRGGLTAGSPLNPTSQLSTCTY